LPQRILQGKPAAVGTDGQIRQQIVPTTRASPGALIAC